MTGEETRHFFSSFFPFSIRELTIEAVLLCPKGGDRGRKKPERQTLRRRRRRSRNAQEFGRMALLPSFPAYTLSKIGGGAFKDKESREGSGECPSVGKCLPPPLPSAALSI